MPVYQHRIQDLASDVCKNKSGKTVLSPWLLMLMSWAQVIKVRMMT